MLRVVLHPTPQSGLTAWPLASHQARCPLASEEERGPGQGDAHQHPVHLHPTQVHDSAVVDVAITLRHDVTWVQMHPQTQRLLHGFFRHPCTEG